RLAKRNGSHEGQLFHHLARESRQRKRHFPRDPQPFVLCDALRVALLSRDVSGIAKLTDHALELFLGQFRELLDERIDVDVVASHLLAEARVLSELPGRPHAIDARIDATLPLAIEYAQRVGN